MRRKVHGIMELWPISLNRSNQFCNCLIWSLTGSTNPKPSYGDQESIYIIRDIQSTHSTVHKNIPPFHHTPASMWSRGSSFTPSFFFSVPLPTWRINHQRPFFQDQSLLKSISRNLDVPRHHAFLPKLSRFKEFIKIPILSQKSIYYIPTASFYFLWFLSDF